MTSAPSQLTYSPERARHGALIEPTHTVNVDSITRAAAWLADQSTPPVPLVPELQRRFDLTAKDACEVCALAGKMRMLRQVFA